MQMVEIIDKPIQEENESKDKAELFFFIKRDDERLSYIEQDVYKRQRYCRAF